MQISGSLPFHIARAYGVRAAAPVRPAEAVRPLARDTAAGNQETARVVERLVAGRVTGEVSFDPAAPARESPAEVLPLYTRAADRIEAAVAVRVGHVLDVTG